MPMYTYTCLRCDKSQEKIIAIDARDSQFCEECGYRLHRNIDRPGMVWAPTAGGMRV